MAPITDEQREIIREHVDDETLTRKQLAELAGVSLSALYRILRTIGAPLNHKLAFHDDSNDDLIRRYYPHYSAREIASLGLVPLSVSVIKRWAKRLGLEHTPECKARLAQKEAAARALSNTPEAKAKAGNRRKRIYRMEYFRVHSGLKQRTNLRLQSCPIRTTKARCYLVKRYGYIRTDNPYVMQYGTTTARNSRAEQYHSARYHLQFVPANNLISKN